MTTVSRASIAATDPDWHGTTPENISLSPENRAWQPDILIDTAERAIVVWSEERSGSRNIYFTEDVAGNWTMSQVISATASPSQYPDVLAVGDEVFVAWVDGTFSTTIYEARKTASTPWEASQIPSPGSGGAIVRLAGGAGRLHALFNDFSDAKIYHTSRALTAGSWPEATPIYTSTAWGAWFPALATSTDGQTLHAAWQDQKSNDQIVITYMSGVVNGASIDWSPAITLSTEIAQSRLPDIEVDSEGDVHVVWGEPGSEDKNEQYVRYTRYNDAADSWSTPVRIDSVPVRVNTDNPTYIAPRLALWEGGNQVKICVAWYGFRTSDSSAEDVLLRCSQDGGEAWSSATENVSRSRDAVEVGWGISFLPAAAFNTSGQLHLAWQERAGSQATTDYEIYHSRVQHLVYLPLVMRNG
ncbi:MAG: hypothetical protein U9R15_05875, partial [Chloroflexota bacterium]|nr:hypothetical protein [Chloroflexota bacterium]